MCAPHKIRLYASKILQDVQLYVVIQCNGHGTIKGCLWLLGRQSGASILSMLKAAKQNHI